MSVFVVVVEGLRNGMTLLKMLLSIAIQPAMAHQIIEIPTHCTARQRVIWKNTTILDMDGRINHRITLERVKNTPGEMIFLLEHV